MTDQLTPQQWGSRAAAMIVSALRSQSAEYAHAAMQALQHSLGTHAEKLADSITVDRAHAWFAAHDSARLDELGYCSMVTADGATIELRCDTIPAPPMEDGHD